MIAPMAAPRPPPNTPPMMAPVAPPTIAPPTGSCAAASCAGITRAMARQAEDPKARINPVLLLNRISHRDTAKQRRAQGNRISKALTVALGWWTGRESILPGPRRPLTFAQPPSGCFDGRCASLAGAARHARAQDKCCPHCAASLLGAKWPSIGFAVDNREAWPLSYSLGLVGGAGASLSRLDHFGCSQAEGPAGCRESVPAAAVTGAAAQAPAASLAQCGPTVLDLRQSMVH
jgi:hypothetical protein